MPALPTLLTSALLAAATAAVVAWLTARLVVTRPAHRPEQQRAQPPCCGVCGRPVESVDAGIEHMDDVHGLRVDRADAIDLLDNVEQPTEATA